MLDSLIFMLDIRSETIQSKKIRCEKIEKRTINTQSKIYIGTKINIDNLCPTKSGISCGRLDHFRILKLLYRLEALSVRIVCLLAWRVRQCSNYHRARGVRDPFPQTLDPFPMWKKRQRGVP